MSADSTPYAFAMSPSSSAVMQAVTHDLGDSYKSLLGHGCYSLVVLTNERLAAKYTVDVASVLWAHQVKAMNNPSVPKIAFISEEPVFEVQGFPVWRIDSEVLDHRQGLKNKFVLAALTSVVAKSLASTGTLLEIQTAFHGTDISDVSHTIVRELVTDNLLEVVAEIHELMVLHPTIMLDVHPANWMWRPYGKHPVLIDPVYGLCHAHAPVKEMQRVGDLLGVDIKHLLSA